MCVATLGWRIFARPIVARHAAFGGHRGSTGLPRLSCAVRALGSVRAASSSRDLRHCAASIASARALLGLLYYNTAMAETIDLTKER